MLSVSVDADIEETLRNKVSYGRIGHIRLNELLIDLGNSDKETKALVFNLFAVTVLPALCLKLVCHNSFTYIKVSKVARAVVEYAQNGKPLDR